MLSTAKRPVVFGALELPKVGSSSLSGSQAAVDGLSAGSDCGVDVARGTCNTLLLHGDDVLLDGVAIRLSPAPAAVLQALLVNPGIVVSRRDLLAALPSGNAGSEHAVEMAVARLRAALGTRCIQTVVKRGYRLAVAP
mgnify:CR=1 FL=1